MDPTALIPHRPPFLFVDRLCAYDAARAEAELDVRAALPLAADGTLSAFLAAEALAQTAAAHAGALARDAAGTAGAAPPGTHRGAFVRLEAFEAPGTARAGDTLRLVVTLDRAFGALRRYRGEAWVGETLVARGTFTFATAP
jgi:3-hydroxymyristoyl/3-hydroxydecanoyl-(acyl carrier protein) dehydratase